MESGLLIFIKLYGPIILFLFFISAMFFVKKEGKTAEVTIRPLGSFFEILEFKIPISSIFLARLLLSIIAIIVMVIPIMLNYSSLFPSHIQMEVFYDEQGIKEALMQFEESEIKSFNIPEDYSIYQEQYYQDLDKEAQDILNTSAFFDSKEGKIHSAGQTSFKVEKIEGIQNYHIAESSGELIHTLEQPNQRLMQFKSFFEKLPSKYDYMNPSLSEIILKHKILMRPEFKQILAQNTKTEGVVFHHSVIGVTKITIFPWPDFGKTVYFVNIPNVGLAPIGYAIYR